MTQTLRRERRQKFLSILEMYYQDNPPSDDATEHNKMVAELLADAATSEVERRTDETFGEYKTRSNVFRIYEENIGATSPLIADQLKDIERDYPEGWFEDAVKEALKNNVRKLAYVLTILDRWKVSGKNEAKKTATSMFETLT